MGFRLRATFESVRLALKVILRRPTVFLSIFVVTGLSAIVTLTLLAAYYPEVSGVIATRIVKEKSGLEIVDGVGDSIVCPAFVDGVGDVIVVAVGDNPRFWGMLNIKPLGWGEAILGSTLASRIGVSEGAILKVNMGGSTYEVRVAGARRFNNFLDVTVIAKVNVTSGSSCLSYEVSEHEVVTIIKAVSSETSKSLSTWYILSLVALTLAITVSSLKTIKDLDKEILELEAQGLRVSHLAYGLATSFTLATLTGSSYGYVLFSIVTSTLGSHLDVYLPPPPTSQDVLLRAVATPALVAMLAPLVAGALIWRHRS